VIYAELRSSAEQRQVLVCGRQARNKLVYMSTSNIVDQLHVTVHASTQPVYFLLEFDGLCSHYSISVNAGHVSAVFRTE